eukprot:416212_1
MNTTIIPSYNFNMNCTFQSGQITQMNHSVINRPQSCGYTSNNKVSSMNGTTINTRERSLIHQHLQQQLMYDALIYERIRIAHQQEHKKVMTKQREAYVGCNTEGFVHFIEDSVLCSKNNIKYSMISELGRGTYSRVFKCRRMDKNCAYAIKVIRNIEKYQRAAMHEIDILKRIKANDVDGASCCIHIKDAGFYFGHPMFVFPLLSNSLRSSITPHNPFSHAQVVQLTWQMCNAMAFIHSLGIINADLKPENIMFVNDESEWTDLQIKIIDFGAAVMGDNDKHHHMVQTREYRAPEVILAKKWSFEVDMWSVGCIVGELVRCKVLFPTRSNAKHLDQIIACIGAPPPNYLSGAIVDDLDIDNLESSPDNLRSCFGLTDEYLELYHLCAQMLCWNAKERITAKQALEHPVFKDY